MLRKKNSGAVKLEVIIGSKTWPNPDISDSEFHLGYHVYIKIGMEVCFWASQSDLVAIKLKLKANLWLLKC